MGSPATPRVPKRRAVETQQQWRKHVPKYLLLIRDVTLQSPAVNRVRTLYLTHMYMYTSLSSFLLLLHHFFLYFFTIHYCQHTCNCYISSRKINHCGAQLLHWPLSTCSRLTVCPEQDCSKFSNSLRSLAILIKIKSAFTHVSSCYIWSSSFQVASRIFSLIFKVPQNVQKKAKKCSQNRVAIPSSKIFLKKISRAEKTSWGPKNGKEYSSLGGFAAC